MSSIKGVIPPCLKVNKNADFTNAVRVCGDQIGSDISY